MGKTALTLLLALALLSGCASRRAEVRAVPPTPVPAGEMPTATAAFTCSMEGISATGQLRWQQDSAIWVSVSKFIELGRALLTPDSLLAYVPPYNQCLRMDMEEARRRFGLDFNSIQSLLMERGFEGPLQIEVPLLGQTLQAHLSLRGKGQPVSFPFSIPQKATPIILSP